MKVVITDNADALLKYFNWSVDELNTIPDFANTKEIEIYDADLHRVFAIADGCKCEIDVDGYVEWMEDK